MRRRSVSACAALVIAASAAWATGPDQQRLPWRPGLVGGQYETVNSVVQLRFTEGDGRTFTGSGTVIGKRTDEMGMDWLCVLTADHNVNGAVDMHVRFGDGAAVADFGGAHTYGAASAVNPTWSKQVPGVDMAVLAVKVNSDPLNGATRAQFAQRIQPCSMIANLNDPSTILNQTFTQAGYGLTGTFSAQGMTTAAHNDTKRFQNNKFESYIPTATAGGYTQDLLRYFFNVPAANGFFAGEGLGYGGDSGGPAFYNHMNTQNVPAFNRPNRDNGDVVPNWGGGNMDILDNVICGVFVSGNSNDTIGGTSPYDTSRGNFVPLTPWREDFITNICSTIPAPGAIPAFALGAIVAFRRRR